MVDRRLFDKQYHTALVGIPAVSTSQSSNYSQRQILGQSFQPSNWDVVCHNSKEYQDHIGNKRFKICVANHLSSYMKAPSRIAKSVVITNLVNSIRDSSTQPHGGFVRFDTSCGLWYEVGEKVARDKVGQALRDAARLQDEKQKSRTVDLSPSLSSHCQQDGQCQVVAEPNIFELEEEVSGGENNDVPMGKHSSRHSAIKWAHTEYIGKFSPASPTRTSNNEDTHPRAGKNRSFWFRRNALQMPAYNSSNEVTTAFAESADDDITSIDDHDQQQH